MKRFDKNIPKCDLQIHYESQRFPDQLIESTPELLSYHLYLILVDC